MPDYLWFWIEALLDGGLRVEFLLLIMELLPAIEFKAVVVICIVLFIEVY